MTTTASESLVRHLLPPGDFLTLKNPSGLRMGFLKKGSPFAIRHGRTLINQALPLVAEDGLFRLAFLSGGVAHPLVGQLASISKFRAGKRSFAWAGESGGFSHEATVAVHPEKPWWVWRVRLINLSGEARRAGVICGQDLGLADEAAVRNNEAYVSQYIDHLAVVPDGFGPVVCSRQNQQQSGGAHPWIAQGCPGGTAFCTDGFQFFGLDHRVEGTTSAWTRERLPSEVRQYEMAYAGLQSAEWTLAPGGTAEVVFFACFEPDHPEVSRAEDAARASRELEDFLKDDETDDGRWESVSDAGRSLFGVAPLRAGREMDEECLHALFPGSWRHVERREGKVMSFFLGEGNHVVTRAKEAEVERPHGHILRSGHALWPEPGIVGSTVWAAGVFSAGVYAGNTNISRFLTVVRNPLNILRASGQRIFVREEAGWSQLGVPSVFEITLDAVRWIYRLGDGALEIEVRCGRDEASVELAIRVTEGPARAFLISHAVTFDADELVQPGQFQTDEEAGKIVCERMDGEAWEIRFAGPLARLGGDELLFEDGCSRGSPFAVIETKALDTARVTITALGVPRGSGGPENLPLSEMRLYHPFDPAVGRVSEILPWFAHNAMIHLAAPHGLEQYSGAAWGTRDVCQGPIEWLLAAGRFGDVRRILLDVFSRQYASGGGWPQWFMHAPFEAIQQAHSHGDIPFWPVKALCDYVEASNDFAVLDEEVPYTEPDTFGKSAVREPLTAHVARVIRHFESRLLAGTALVNYGDGDWDDTLQPADAALRSSMVSSWTVGLAFHAFRLWGGVCARSGRTPQADEARSLCAAMARDFREHLLIDGVAAGFAVAEEGGFRPLLHPRDEVTKIRYRLLPMTRGILAELFDAGEARLHASLIAGHLLFPDGARLMSDPVPYKGGVETIFRRAETAANFGREIGLQYVHAHIRYAEAMAKIGDASALWRALQVINPVAIHENVPNALPRQSNAYFSSSDGDFAHRYEAGRRFSGLRDGSVGVKGGWRIYSSGAGLYLHKVMTCLLGWRESFGDLVLDPVLPRELDGLEARFEWKGRQMRVLYRVKTRCHTPETVRINGRTLKSLRPDPSPYRTGGVRLSVPEWSEGENLVEITM